MSAFRIFIDESGNAEPSDFKRSPYFCLSGILINEESSKKLEFQMNRIKLKYFSRADYIIHSTDLRYHLVKNNHLLDKFAKEIGDVINQCRFSFLSVIVKKKNYYEKKLTAKSIYQQTYRILLSNILKYLVINKTRGYIIAEASNSNQDIHLYNAFFHLIRGGISRLNIDHKIAKKYFTSLNFVTKVNNDSGTQLADLFGIYGRTELEIRKGKKKIEKLDCLESMIYKLAKKKLLRGEEQFKINSFKILS